MTCGWGCTGSGWRGELTEIREADLRFTAAEAREMFDAAGVALPDSAVMMLHERTEGWAAGVRMAALSLAGRPDPERLAAEFSGTERTVAEYLLAEVLERQPDSRLRRPRMPSWRWWPRPMSWPAGRWRRRSGTWGWPALSRVHGPGEPGGDRAQPALFPRAAERTSADSPTFRPRG